MHVNRTFSLKIGTVQELNDTVRPKLRSKFVDRAINERLNPQEINVNILGTRRLMAILVERDDVTDFLKQCIRAELNAGMGGLQ